MRGPAGRPIHKLIVNPRPKRKWDVVFFSWLALTLHKYPQSLALCSLLCRKKNHAIIYQDRLLGPGPSARPLLSLRHRAGRFEGKEHLCTSVLTDRKHTSTLTNHVFTFPPPRKTVRVLLRNRRKWRRPSPFIVRLMSALLARPAVGRRVRSALKALADSSHQAGPSTAPSAKE